MDAAHYNHDSHVCESWYTPVCPTCPPCFLTSWTYPSSLTVDIEHPLARRSPDSLVSLMVRKPTRRSVLFLPQLLCPGRLPGLHLVQVRLVDPQDDVHVLVLAVDRQPVLLGHALGLPGSDVDLDLTVLVDFIPAFSPTLYFLWSLRMKNPLMRS